jgi:hypothetical protein
VHDLAHVVVAQEAGDTFDGLRGPIGVACDSQLVLPTELLPGLPHRLRDRLERLHGALLLALGAGGYLLARLVGYLPCGLLRLIRNLPDGALDATRTLLAGAGTLARA